MTYTEAEARDLIIEAGHRLVEAGLIARTWGNISARISDTQFLITPSGMAYEGLRPDQLVAVRIDDCSYNGETKPSSEKGIHADVYRLRPEVNFVIHTHQDKATVAGLPGRDLRAGIHLDGSCAPVLGRCVPCAPYGLSSTKKLRHGVAATVAAHPESAAVLMPHHGALCMGRDCEHAFQIAAALENACEARIAACFREAGQEVIPPLPGGLPDYGSSAREGDSFCLVHGGKTYVFPIGGPLSALPLEAAAHAEIYRTGSAAFIRHETDPQVVAVSAEGKALRPLLDDLVQIAGVDIRHAPRDPELIARLLAGRNAVLVEGAGALCTGTTADDAAAVCQLLRKGCAAQRFAALHGGVRPLSALDARLQRTVYLAKYAKLKK